MIDPNDFLNSDMPATMDPKEFLGLTSTTPPVPTQAQALSAAGIYEPFAQPDPVGDYGTPELKASMVPTKVIPLPFGGQVGMDRAMTPALKMQAAAHFLNRPATDFILGKDGNVWTTNGEKVGGLGGTGPVDAAGNLLNTAAAEAYTHPASTALNVGGGLLSTVYPPAAGVVASPLWQGSAAAVDEAMNRYLGKNSLPQEVGAQPIPFGVDDLEHIGTAGAAGLLGTWGLNKIPYFLKGAGNLIDQAVKGFPNGLRAIFPKAALSSVTPAEVAAAQGAMSGPIPLTLGQATGNPTLLSDEARLRMLPGGLEVAKSQAIDQNAAARGAVDAFTGKYASSPDAAVLGQNTVTGANAVKNALISERGLNAGPVYSQAMGSGVTTDLSPVLDTVDNLINSEGTSEMAKSQLRLARKQLFNPDGSLKSTPEGVQAAKEGIDSVIDGLMSKGTPKVAAPVIQTNNALKDLADSSIPDYSRARTLWQNFSEPINQFDNSLLGEISQMGKDDAIKAPGMLLNSGTTTPSMVARYRDMGQLNPQAWTDTTMAPLVNASRNFESSALGGPGNYAGTVYKKVLGSDADRAMYQAAMSPEQFQELDTLMDNMRRASQGAHGQSWTFAGPEAKEQLSQDAMGPLARRFDKALSLGVLAQPGKWKEAFQSWAFNRNAPAVANLLFNPPTNWPDLIPYNVINALYQNAMMPARAKSVDSANSLLTGALGK
jgi:hypothetical protein